MKGMLAKLLILSGWIVCQAREVDYLEIEGVIGPVISEFLLQNITEAENKEAAILIIALDTPGGLDESMRIIVKKILRSRVPICIFVSPRGARAASAGVFIAAASHIAAMAPGTNMGAAHPVSFGKEMDSTISEKATNDAVAYLKTILQVRGRPLSWAEEAVRHSKSITENEAQQVGVIDLVAEDLEDLLLKLEGKKIILEEGKEVTLKLANLPIKIAKMGLRERILAILANPNVAYILLILGFYGLFFELSHPGTIFPGVFGLISLILAFYSFQTLPVNYAGVLLIVLAMILFIAEVKIQSHGLLGLGGGISLLLGSLFLFETTIPYLKISWSTIITVLIVTLLFFFFIIAKGIGALRRKAVSGIEGLVGTEGLAKTEITPQGGTVLLHGELWNATSDSVIEKGNEVIVKEVKGLKVKVQPKTSIQNTEYSSQE